MCFHLHQDVHRLLAEAVGGVTADAVEALGIVTDDHRRIVLVGRQDIGAVILVGVLDHAKQRLRRRLAINGPRGIEDLVAAVLGVGLRKHHQLDVVGVATKLGEVVDQIIDFVRAEREALLTIGIDQRLATTTKNIDRGQRARRFVREQHASRFGGVEHHFRHAIVQLRGQGLPLGGIQRFSAGQPVGRGALDAAHIGQPGIAGNVGGFR